MSTVGIILFVLGLVLAFVVATVLIGVAKKEEKEHREFEDYMKRLRSKDYERDNENYGEKYRED